MSIVLKNIEYKIIYQLCSAKVPRGQRSSLSKSSLIDSNCKSLERRR